MDKMKNDNKKFGRCRVFGHGSRCEVSKEIQNSFVSRVTEKHQFMKQEKELDIICFNQADAERKLKKETTPSFSDMNMKFTI